VGLAVTIAAAPGAASAHAHRSGAAKARRAAASAEPVFVLQAGGQTVPNGALVNVAGAGKPEYLFKTHVLIQEAPAPSEYELECENYLEQGTIERNPSTDTWRIVNVHPVEICEGEPWLEEGFSENRLTLSPGGIASDESTVEMFRNEEAIRAEERKQAEKSEAVNPHEPRRCAFTTIFSKGKYTRNLKKPLIVKVKNKMIGKSLAIGKGCVTKATWHGSFTLSYKGQPIFPGFETPPSPPAVSSLSPNEGPEAGGTSVQISGSGFSGATAVKFGSASATSFKVNSPESITAVSPAGTGTVHVTVTTADGTSAMGAADEFTY
jgi:hypothetical protein